MEKKWDTAQLGRLFSAKERGVIADLDVAIEKAEGEDTTLSELRQIRNRLVYVMIDLSDALAKKVCNRSGKDHEWRLLSHTNNDYGIRAFFYCIHCRTIEERR